MDKRFFIKSLGIGGLSLAKASLPLSQATAAGKNFRWRKRLFSIAYGLIRITRIPKPY